MNDLGKNEEAKQINQDDLPEASDNIDPDDEVMPEAVIKPEAVNKIDAEVMPDAEIKPESEELKSDASADDSAGGLGDAAQPQE